MYYIGVDLGGTNIAAGIVDEKYRVLVKGKVPTHASQGVDAIILNISSLCRQLMDKLGISEKDIAYLGLVAPGTCDCDAGEVVYTNNLPFLHYHIVDALKAVLPIKHVYIENDANAAALGEAFAGAACDTRDSVTVTLGTGVGCGVIVDKKVYRGFNFAAGEAGHMVLEYNGRQCTCGRKGCWEAYSSATALISMTKEKMLDSKSSLMWSLCKGDISSAGGRTAFEAMRRGDKYAAEVVDMYIRYLACGITNLINILQPEVLCIGGGVCGEGKYLLDPLLPIVSGDQYSRYSLRKTRVEIAKLGNDAGIVGGAVLGL